MSANIMIAQAAQKGAAMGASLGSMCATCAFKLNSDANLEEHNVDAAFECLAYEGIFHCHRHDTPRGENFQDAGTVCVGFRYAKRYFEWLAADVDRRDREDELKEQPLLIQPTMSTSPNITRKPGEDLTIVNYFEPLSQVYPDAMEKFKKWFDEYKLKVNWKVVFQSNVFEQDVKFHNIPLALQVGVLMHFLDTNTQLYFHYACDEEGGILDNMVNRITNGFRYMQEQLSPDTSSTTDLPF